MSNMYTVNAINPNTLEVEEALVTETEFEGHREYQYRFPSGLVITNAFTSTSSHEDRQG